MAKSNNHEHDHVCLLCGRTSIEAPKGITAGSLYLCEDCLAKGLIKRAEEVHHKIKLTPENINNPEITLSWSNLRALCKDCHLNVHRKPKRWRVDENGEVTLKGPP